MVWSQSRRFALAALWTAFVLCGAVLDSRAGGLSIAPTRLLFTGGERVSTVYLTNKSDRAATYRILVRDKRMLETGQIVDAPDPRRGELFAADFIRYSPRRVVIPAGGSQTVRILLRNPSEELEQVGEYRTHLIFQSVPEPPSLDDAARDDGLKAQAIIETSIPVIIRRGDPEATVVFGDCAVDSLPDRQGRPVVDLELRRTGDRSVYGDIDVFWIDTDGRDTQVSRIKGIAVYTPTPHRAVALPLTFPDGALPQRGVLAVRFSETPEGGGDLVAETVIDLAPPLDEDADTPGEDGDE